MRILSAILALAAVIYPCLVARADEPLWARKSFQADTPEYAFVVGVGTALDELTALREARRHALATLIQSYFAEHSKASLKIVEGTHGVLVEDRVSTALYDLDLTAFEKIDQFVAAQELPVRQVTVKSLYQFPKKLIEQHRQSKRGEAATTSADEQALDRKVREAKFEEDQRERERIDGEEAYRSTYSLLGLEMDVGYQKISRFSFLVVGMGLPLCLRLLSDRLVLRPFATFGFGDSNKIADEQSNDADRLSYTSSVSLGADLRFYFYQGTSTGFYLVGQAAQDRVTPTCGKTNTGKCVSDAESPFTRTSYSGGIGVVIPSKHPIGLEMLYGSDQRIGVTFKLGIPFLK